VANFVRNFTIAATANPTAGGSVAGAGSYTNGANVTLSATANAGYLFLNWTENGSPVSTSAAYTFTASANRTLVANFIADSSPALTIQRADATNAIFISWPTQPPGYVLQERLALGPNSSWSPVTNQLTVVGGLNHCVVLPHGTNRFYRLLHP
jgi:hypothetical protein